MDAARPAPVYLFGPFRLDVAERRLTRDGRPLALRAKVFDTLVALLQRPGRLVTREELIELVWPDSIVEEGNLSHNVSALRKALGDGRPARYVETVPRRGYRFVHPVEQGAAETPAEDPAGARAAVLERARRFFEQGAWSEAYRLLAGAAEAAPLPAADQARLAEAARWCGRHDELIPLLECAAEAYRREGDALGAARAALEVATVLVDRRRLALAASYLRQAQRSLPAEARPDAPGASEHARLARLQGRLLWTEGNWEGALERSRVATALARAAGDREAEAMAVMDGGHSLLALERFEEGAAALEEAGAVVISGEVGPYASGLTQCGLIVGWRACGRWDRAAEWVDASVRWADGAGVAYFPGLCRVHRGELICMRGDLARAEEDLVRGTQELFRADSALAGPGLRELGTVRLRRGDLAGAQEAFGRALEFGTDPQPGLALLRAANGEAEAARRDLERFLSEHGSTARNLLDREHRFEALAALVPLALATGAPEVASGAARQLATIAAATRSNSHRAAADCAAGEVALAAGRTSEALARLRESWRAWAEVPAPYEAACARTKLGEALLAEGDPGRALMEFEGAAATFERLGAALELERLKARLGEPAQGAAEGRPGLVAWGEIAGADELRALVGDEAWSDLVAWLERKLTRCWTEHGGRTLEFADGRYAVAFDELSTCLTCVTFVQQSLREHRALHGFAPSLRLGIAPAAALPGEADRSALEALAARIASEGAPGEVVIATEGAATETLPELARLREAGVSVRLVDAALLGGARGGRSARAGPKGTA